MGRPRNPDLIGDERRTLVVYCDEVIEADVVRLQAQLGTTSSSNTIVRLVRLQSNTAVGEIIRNLELELQKARLEAENWKAQATSSTQESERLREFAGQVAVGAGMAELLRLARKSPLVAANLLAMAQDGLQCERASPPRQYQSENPLLRAAFQDVRSWLPIVDGLKVCMGGI